MADIIESLLWIDSTGLQWNLTNGTPYFIPNPGMDGIYGLNNAMVTHIVPGQPGYIEQYDQIAQNDIKFPLMIFGPTLATIAQSRRALQEAMRTSRGQGVLRHTANDGIQRDLNCREISGFRTMSSRTPSMIMFGLEFAAADPYWYDIAFTSTILSPNGLLNFFGAPFLPIKLSAGGISSNFTVFNSGQAFAYPIWTVTGPGVNPVLTNSTTNETLTVTITLAAGQVLTINTNPGVATVTREDGSNQWATVSSTSELWPLTLGANVITLGMTGTTTASSLQLQFKQRWESV